MRSSNSSARRTNGMPDAEKFTYASGSLASRTRSFLSDRGSEMFSHQHSHPAASDMHEHPNSQLIPQSSSWHSGMFAPTLRR
jgi:hypothetical protein